MGLPCIHYRGFNPRTHEGYDIEAEERPYLICALIPVSMKGTIMIFLQMKSYPLIALIPVPVKGTIQSTEALMSAFTILIPVPMKGTILIKLGFPK